MGKKKNRNRNRVYRQVAPAQGATAQRAADAGATIPQDHLQEAEATGGTVAVDYKGFHVEAALEDLLDDYEAMSQMSQGLPAPMLRLLFPDDRERSRFLRERCTDATGRVRLTAAIQETAIILQALGLGN